MTKSIKIYSFADVDRSGKVRWAACELGYDIEEHRLDLGEHRQGDYLQLNPYSQIPTAVIGDETWIESTAICLQLAERHPEAGLIPDDPLARASFWQLVHLTSSTLEFPVVNYFLASRGIINEDWKGLVSEGISARMKTFAASLPQDGYLCGSFSIADICAAYVLRIAVQSELLPYEGVLASYMDLLRARPAAGGSRMFDSLET